MTEEELLDFTELDEDFAELLLDSGCFSELLEDNLSPRKLEELIGSTELLLDFAELLLNSAFELEDFAELLLDSGSLPGMTEEELLDFTELDDDLVSFSSFDEEDFAFSLLEEFFWTLELDDFAELLLDPIASLQDDDKGLTLDEDFTELDELLLSSLIGSSFGPAEDEESSPHATNIIAAATIATTNFFISPPVIRYKLTFPTDFLHGQF